MGAGASAASMSMEERKSLYKTMKGKYTIADLDALKEEEKQAWMEVLAEGKDLEPAEVAGDGDSSAKQDAAELANTTARAAAALSGSGVPPAVLGGGDGGKIRPQGRSTRMSYHLAPEVGETEPQINCVRASLSQNEDGAEGLTLEGIEGRVSEAGVGEAESAGAGRVPPEVRRLSVAAPSWKRSAIEMETHAELSIGDVVRVRDESSHGMWFEGILTAIHDESNFTVELTDYSQSDNVDYVTVGIEDVVRVMPWYCIEVGDIVECLAEEAQGWLRGTVIGIDSVAMVYDVKLDYDPMEAEMPIATVDSMDGEGMERECNGDYKEKQGNIAATAYQVTDDRIRKICSARQAIARQWKEDGI